MKRITESAGTTPDAGAIALHIAEIASRTQQKCTLACKLAYLLLAELRADAVAFFWQEDMPKHPETHPQLQTIAAIAQEGALPQSLERTMKALAYRAYRGRQAKQHTITGTYAGYLLARPIGAAAPWACCTVWWSEEHQQHQAQGTILLAQLSACLATATMPANLLDLSRRAEYELSQRKALLSATSEAILSIGDDFIIKEVNPAFGDITGWGEPESAGRSCTEVLRCRDSRHIPLCGTSHCPLRQALDAGSSPPVQELYWETSAGRLRDISASFTPHTASDASNVVVVARDDTLLNAVNRMRSNFISMVSHELRTPLNSINGFIEIVAEEQVGPLNERQQEFLGYVRTSTQQLTTLVEDIVFISKADSGQFTLRLGEIAIQNLLRQALQSVQPAAEKAGVRIISSLHEGIPLFRGDELRLQQVLTNLLNNAIKFSPQDTEIRVTAERIGSTVQFSVQDQGKGIPLEEHAHVFERFYQSESSQRARSGGYGLGLAIAKLIVEQHEGRIWLESAPGSGSTFYVALPVADS